MPVSSYDARPKIYGVCENENGGQDMRAILTTIVSSLLIAAGVFAATTASAGTTVMTFDTVPFATPLPNGRSFTECDMIVTSFSDFSSIGTPLPGPPGNNLYFHGTDHYMEFRTLDGSRFDLHSLDFITNGFTSARSLETSNGHHEDLPGYTTLTTINFAGTGVEDLEWFRIRTPWFATQMDNVTVTTTTECPTACGEVLVPSIYGGMDFPAGAKSFADAVLEYDPLFSGGPASGTPYNVVLRQNLIRR